jgi:hypothetical protein
MPLISRRSAILCFLGKTRRKRQAPVLLQALFRSGAPEASLSGHPQIPLRFFIAVGDAKPHSDRRNLLRPSALIPPDAARLKRPAESSIQR